MNTKNNIEEDNKTITEEFLALLNDYLKNTKPSRKLL